MKVIDVSQYNGVIKWDKVAKDCDGVILRVGYRGYSSGSLVLDKKFNYNFTQAKLKKIPIGVYFVTQAINEKEAREEARYTTNLLKGYKLDLPVFIDSENANNGKGRADAGKLTKSKRTDILKAFCAECEKIGYESGVYASQSWFNDYTTLKELQKYFIWVARYASVPPTINYDAWQYTSVGKVSGILGNVDISKFKYKTKKKTTSKATTKKSNEAIAKEVIAGKWGNGEARKKKLEKAGYNYKTIQALVNKLLKK